MNGGTYGTIRGQPLPGTSGTVKGLAPSTIETIYVIFASIMRGAVRDGYIRKTPCEDIRLPEKIPTTVRLLTPVQVLDLARAMPTRYGLLVLLGRAPLQGMCPESAPKAT